MSDSIVGALAFGLAFGVSALLIRMLLPWLVQRAILDRPNERSSHTTPTPRGGGIAVTLTSLLSLFAAALWSGANIMPVLWIAGAAILLATVSWLDDLKGLRAAPRLLAQIAAAGIGVWDLAKHGLVFQGLLPPALDMLVAGIGLIWFINLFNFMDGIDGISGVEGVSLGIGAYLVLTLLTADPISALPIAAAGFAGAFAGFLLFNWHPARLFLGDVGSVPMGYLFGLLLLALAVNGHWVAALILPAYYLADATLTLIRRLLRGEAPWRAHREHFYQQACASLDHAAVVRRIAIGNTILVLLALTSAAGGMAQWLALAGAAIVVAGLLWMLRRAGQA